MRITHVVVTDAFAGTERYVCEVASRQADRGHDVLVLGGSSDRMPAELRGARWRAAASVPAAVRGLMVGGPRDVVHTHLSAADIAGALTTSWHRALLVSTRHIAGRRGRSVLGALSVPIIERRVDLEIAISDYVARALSSPPAVVLRNGVSTSDLPYDRGSRRVLVLQRLEPEKATEVAIGAWRVSGLAEHGWSLVIAGDGSCRGALQEQARDAVGVDFLGHVDDVRGLLAATAVLLAPATAEPLGLSVLEAMAAGVPVLAAASAGHLETLPPGWPWTFPAGDMQTAGTALRALAMNEDERLTGSGVLRARQRERFDVERHVDDLIDAYSSRRATRRGPRANR